MRAAKNPPAETDLSALLARATAAETPVAGTAKASAKRAPPRRAAKKKKKKKK